MGHVAAKTSGKGQHAYKEESQKHFAFTWLKYRKHQTLRTIIVRPKGLTYRKKHKIKKKTKQTNKPRILILSYLRKLNTIPNTLNPIPQIRQKAFLFPQQKRQPQWTLSLIFDGEDIKMVFYRKERKKELVNMATYISTQSVTDCRSFITRFSLQSTYQISKRKLINTEIRLRKIRLRNHRSWGDQTQQTCPCQTRTFTRKNQPSHSVQNSHTRLLSEIELLQNYKNKVQKTQILKTQRQPQKPKKRDPKNPD